MRLSALVNTNGFKGEKTPVARKGGGRKRSADKHLKSDIAVLVESSTRGDPESPLK